MRGKRVSAFVAAAILGSTGAAAWAAPFAGGTFEGTGLGQNDYPSNTTIGSFVVGDPNGTGATAASDSDAVFIRTNDASRAHGGVASITFYGGSRTTQELYQTFDTTPGLTYTVGFFDREAQVGPNNNFKANVYDGQLNASAAGLPFRNSNTQGAALGGVTIADVPNSTYNATPTQFTFTAASGTSTLVFRTDNTAGDAEIDLDDVTVAVPEPASAGLLGLGALGLLARRRRR